MEQKAIESYRKAGQIAKQVREYCKEIIKKDILLIEIAEKIEDKIQELGGDLAFPTNLSINEIAAHYTPSSEDKTKSEGLLKIDFGVSINGYIADTALSFDLSEDKKFQEIIDTNNEALNFALDNLTTNSKAKDIGKFITQKIKNFNIIKNLSGHALDKDIIHAGLTISNYENNNETKLKGAFAIEPFLTSGVGEIYEGKPSEIYQLTRNSSVRDSDARKLIQFISENYKTKPFCKRWLEKQGFKKLNFILSNLTMQGILHNYPVLIEKSKKPVSQSEHTILITDKVEVLTR